MSTQPTYPCQVVLRTQLGHALELGQENSILHRAERKLILQMAHIQQGRYELDRIAALIPNQHREAFKDCVANALLFKSACYRRRALVVTFFMLGIPYPLIAEFLMLSQHAIREF